MIIRAECDEPTYAASEYQYANVVEAFQVS